MKLNGSKSERIFEMRVIARMPYCPKDSPYSKKDSPYSPKVSPYIPKVSPYRKI